MPKIPLNTKMPIYDSFLAQEFKIKHLVLLKVGCSAQCDWFQLFDFQVIFLLELCLSPKCIFGWKMQRKGGGTFL